MYRFKCKDCSRNQYSANKESRDEPCIYCGGNEVKLMEDLKDEEDEEYL